MNPRSLALIFSLLMCTLTFAQDSEWTGASDDNWSNPLNWSPNSVPSSQAEAGVIPAAGSPVRFNESFEIGGVTLGAGVTLEILPGEVLHYYGEVLPNDGVIQISDNTSTGETSLRVFVDTELSGSGRIDLLDPAGLGSAKLETGLGAIVTQGEGHTIGGHGVVSAFLVNNGTIAGDDSGETLLLLSTEVVNNGLLLGEDSGTLHLAGVVLEQSPLGVIRAEESGIVLIDTATVHGGSIETEAGGKVRVALPNTVEFEDVENLGLLEVIAGGRLQVLGAELINQGEIILDATDTSINSHLHFVEADVLDGSGLVEIRNFSTLTIDPPGGLTQRVDHTIRGEGFLAGDLINEGTLEPGLPIGTLTSSGGYTQAPTGRLRLDVSGSAFGEFDRLVLGDDVMLGGTLEVDFADGFVPTVGESIEIVTVSAPAAMISGTFDELSIPTVDLMSYTVRYEATSVFLDPLPSTIFRRGDCNLSGDNDVSDVIYLLGHLFPIGTPNPLDCFDACDANDDGEVDISDVVEELNSLFGQPASSLPEPNGLCGEDPTSDGIGCDSYPPCL